MGPLLLVIGGSAIIGLLWYRSTSEASIPPQGDVEMLSLRGTFLPDSEVSQIIGVALSVGVDARLLAAIRKAENGGPGREFGILSVAAPTYQQQAQIAANTIRNTMTRYQDATGASPTQSSGRLSPAFIAYLGAKYAPVGAGNDRSEE